MTSRRVIASIIGSVALLAAVTEAAYRRAVVEPSALDSASCIVLVLGYPTEADGGPNTIQRFRVDAGVRLYRELRCSKIVFSGGAVRNTHIEAESMAAIARSLGVVEAAVIIEPRARTTWENIGCASPHFGIAEHVYVVSDSLHAQRGARYACRQDERSCGAVSAAGANPPLGLLWWKVPAGANELAARIRDRLFYEGNASANAPRCASE